MTQTLQNVETKAPEETLLTVKQVATRLQLSVSKVLKLVKTRAFPNAVSISGNERATWRIPETDLTKYIDSRRISK